MDGGWWTEPVKVVIELPRPHGVWIWKFCDASNCPVALENPNHNYFFVLSRTCWPTSSHKGRRRRGSFIRKRKAASLISWISLGWWMNSISSRSMFIKEWLLKISGNKGCSQALEKPSGHFNNLSAPSRMVARPNVDFPTSSKFTSEKCLHRKIFGKF